MNEEQKQRAADLLSAWRATAYALHGDRMAALLQDLVDAPEAEPFAVIHLDGSFVHVEFKQPIAGTGKFEVYAAPSVPEAEPAARVTGYYAGYLTIATIDGRVLPAGTALYLAPPAPSVPDGWRPFLTDVITAAGLLEHGKRDKGLAGRIGKFAFDAMRATPQPPKLSDERILEIAMSDDVSLVDDQGIGARPRLIVHNSIGAVYALVRTIEREILGGGE